MELRDFVSETLKQIIDGTQTAQEYAQSHNAAVNPDGVADLSRKLLWDTTESCPLQQVAFDVALTASEGSKTKGGIGVFLGAWGLGSQGESDASSTSLSQIRFSVPVSLPVCHPP